MRKIFVLSFDDGTIYDRRFVQLLQKYNVPCTFNLNSGLDDFVWYYEDRHPIRRFQLEETKDVYRDFEIASHSSHHFYLTSLSDEDLDREIAEDCAALKRIFGVEELGFAVPFTSCGEREVEIIKPHVRYIRHSAAQKDFSLPRDAYHINISGMYDDPDIKDRIRAFAECDLETALFVLCGHSYEFEVLNHWEYMEELLQYIKSFDFEIMTTMELVNQGLF